MEHRQYWGTGKIRKLIFNFRGSMELANLFLGNRYIPGMTSLIQCQFDGPHPHHLH